MACASGEGFQSHLSRQRISGRTGNEAGAASFLHTETVSCCSFYQGIEKLSESRKEPWLGTPARTIEILQKYGFRFQKKYGQNFLIDPHVLEKIIRAAGIGRDDCVIEIGPGIGTLTQYLAYASREVYAVEIDRNLIPILEDTLSDWDNVTVINQDILTLDLNRFVEEHNGGRPVKVVANLPYYITTPILMELLEKKVPLESVTVMVQKEVAERMQASPGTKDYGALSLAVQYYSRPEIVANVPPNCFMPRPNVGSAVIRLTGRSAEERVQVQDEGLMFRLIRASFAQRRKTLFNGLRNSRELDYSREQIESAMEKCGLSENIRGEALDLKQFADLADALSGKEDAADYVDFSSGVKHTPVT